MLHRTATFVILILTWALPLSHPTTGQLVGTEEPSLGYYKAMGMFHEGSFADALELFQESARLGIRTVNGRWYDSICYYTMMGECMYAMGNLPQALDQYNAALSILVANPRWMEQVQFPAVVGPQAASDRIVIPWSPLDRKSVPGDFSSPMQVRAGRLDDRAFLRPGIGAIPPEYHLLNVSEVVRCLAVSLRRRIELLGPLGQHDPFSRELADSLEGLGGTRNPWSQAWIDVQYGLALSGRGNHAEATAALERAILIGGTYTHPASGIALFELGRLAGVAGSHEQAESYYLTASVAAGEFRQFALVEEALAQATVSHILRNQVEPLAETSIALDWSRRERIRHLTASLLVDKADNLIALGQVPEAAEYIAEARRARGRRTGLSAQLTARLESLAAVVAFRNRQLNAANAALGNALSAQKLCSPWLFQIGLADSWYNSRAVDQSNQLATELYGELLREPTADDWVGRPLETLVVHQSPHVASYENWLTACLARGEVDRAFLVSELLRRHRFHSEMPMGGRLLSLRWILEAPQEHLDRACIQLRNDLRTRMPEFAELSQRANELRDTLTKQAWAGEDAAEQQDGNKRLVAQFAELGKLAENQEMILGEIALRREMIPLVFPPIRTAEELQSALQPHQAALVFASAGTDCVAFLVSHDGLFHWHLPSNREWHENIRQLLRAIGLVQPNGTINEKILASENWKGLAATLRESITDRAHHDFWSRFDELIIVPDGILWYLPFEILPAELDQPQLLGSRVKIRYLPTAGLVATSSAPRMRFPKTTVVAGKLHPRDDANVGDDRLSELQSVVRNVQSVSGKLPIPSGLARCFWDRLVVLNRLDASAGSLSWSPINVDAGRPDGSMARWMQLPWGAPREVLLPGFTTAAENSGRGGDGREVEQALLGLMASGSRTVLLSRWRTGGQSTFDLLREFLQEVDQSSPAEAWQRSVMIVRQQQLFAQWEPRLTVTNGVDVVSADHPFFWATYLLADPGEPANFAATPERPADNAQVAADSEAEGGQASNQATVEAPLSGRRPS